MIVYPMVFVSISKARAYVGVCFSYIETFVFNLDENNKVRGNIKVNGIIKNTLTMTPKWKSELEYNYQVSYRAKQTCFLKSIFVERVLCHKLD